MDSVTLYVTYQGNLNSYFDRDYYANRHLPLVKKSFAQYGLMSISVFYPEILQTGTLVICECIFRDEAAIHTAFSSSEATEVMDDVAHFTDISPVRLRGIPL
ncbi:hypothetical protein D781_1387 [Serratia sp. FGI94]|uniref:EthD family reductase n=1 Tax=Serratia sp. FGI94 TaxID=671990 RepID=UPI0002A70CCD|nr:EthD family reductase [Serratia sp. FGI94]AGB81695.1 hypothetical protein D781_1387 [Serratia sp. FGI94]